MSTVTAPFPQKPTIATPPVSVFRVGRWWVRLLFHLQQLVLLQYDFTHRRSAVNRQANPGKLANRAFAILERSLHGLDIIDTIDLLDACQDLWDSGQVKLYGDDLFDALGFANFELQGRPEYHVGRNLCEAMVKEFAKPLAQDIRHEITSRLNVKQRDLLELGECLEEIQCRKDVWCYLTKSGTWPELLDRVQFEQLMAGIVTDFPPDDEAHADPENGKNDADELPVLADTSRAPGDLAPHPGWEAKLRRAWAKAGLIQPFPAALVELAAACNRGLLLKEQLRKAVDQVCDAVEAEVTDVGIPALLSESEGNSSGYLEITIEDRILKRRDDQCDFANKNKAWKLVQRLLLAGAEGAKREALLRDVWGDSPVSPNNLDKQKHCANAVLAEIGATIVCDGGTLRLVEADSQQL